MSTIVSLLEDSCRINAQRIALTEKVAGEWCSITYAQLWQKVEAIAAGLEGHHFQHGGHAAILAPSSSMWVAAYLGTLRAGGIVVPVDKELKSAELRHVLTDCDASVLFTTETYLDAVIEFIEDLPGLRHIVLIDQALSGHSAFSEPARVVASLVEEWHDLVENFNLPGERVSRVEELAQQAHALLTQARPRGGNDRLTVNLFSDPARARQKLHKKGRLAALKDFAAPSVTCNVPGRQEGDTAVILYTSGTTGRSKGAMLSHRNIVSNVLAAQKHFDLDTSVHMLSFLPINHVFEQVCGILLPLSLGGRVTFAESLKRLGENVREVMPSFFLGVPAVYRLFLDRIYKNIAGKTLSRSLFRFPLTRGLVSGKVRKAFGNQIKFVSGGAALDPEVQKGFQDLGFKIYQGYGITETAPVISAESPFAARCGTVGRPLEGVDVRIDEANAEGVGEIVVRGPNVMQGYYKNPKATAEVLTDGWYRTGDLGKLSADGYLSICGRVKNLIVTPNGKNVYPEEIENELLKSPFIAEAMVYGHKVGPHAEEVHAMIYPDQEALDAYGRAVTMADVESLIRQEVQDVSQRLADYKRIRRFTLRDEEFPKTTTRKIKRFAVEAELSS